MRKIIEHRILFAAAGLLALGTVAWADDTPARPRDEKEAAEIGAPDRKPAEASPGRTAKQTDQSARPFRSKEVFPDCPDKLRIHLLPADKFVKPTQIVDIRATEIAKSDGKDLSYEITKEIGHLNTQSYKDYIPEFLDIEIKKTDHCPFVVKIEFIGDNGDYFRNHWFKPLNMGVAYTVFLRPVRLHLMRGSRF